MGAILENILIGLKEVAAFDIIGMIFLGVLIGSVFGLIPGLTATMAVAVLSPLTLTLDPLLAIPFLIGVYRGGLWGGVVTAVLLGVPGTAANVPTLLDGHPLARKGYPQTAMRSALYGSVMGAVFASLLLFTLVGPVASAALEIGSPELFGLMFFSLTLVSFLSGRHIAKGWLAAGLGLGVSMIGLDPIIGTPRFTFGVSELLGGVEIIPMVIGLFAISEIALQIEARLMKDQGVALARSADIQRQPDDQIKWRTVIRRYWRTILQASATGAFIGVLPGIGSETSPWISYTIAKRTSKRGANFGKGEPEGVVATEVSNDAVVGAAFIPLLVFGIPGDLPLAVMLGAFLAQGLRPGPSLFRDQPEVMYGIVAAVLVSSLALYVLGRLTISTFARVLDTPKWVLYPAILVISIAGAFANENTVFDVYVMAFFGIVGYLFRRTGVPLAPFILAFVLGPRVEQAFRESLLLDTSIGVFFSSPLSSALVIAALLVLVLSPIGRNRLAGAEALSDVEPISDVE